MEIKKKSLLTNALSYGIIAGVILILIGVLYYILDVNIFQFTMMAVSFLVNFGIIIVLMVIGIKAYRDKSLGGKIDYAKSFLSGLLICTFAMVLSGLFNFVFYNYFDPDYMPKMLDNMVEMFENLNMSEEQIDLAIARSEKNMKPINQLISTLYTGPIAGVILSLIVSIFIKKEPALSASDSQL